MNMRNSNKKLLNVRYLFSTHGKKLCLSDAPGILPPSRNEKTLFNYFPYLVKRYLICPLFNFQNCPIQRGNYGTDAKKKCIVDRDHNLTNIIQSNRCSSIVFQRQTIAARDLHKYSQYWHFDIVSLDL